MLAILKSLCALLNNNKNMSMSAIYGNEGTEGPLLSTTNVWGYPREPTPGSSFNLSKKPFGKVRNDDSAYRDVYGNLISSNVGSKITGVNDAQMTVIPSRHTERQKPGKSILSGLSSGGIFNTADGGGIFSSIVGSNGSLTVGMSQLSSLTTSTSDLLPSLGYSNLSGMGFDTDNMEDEDEMNTVKGFHRNGQVTGPEYLIVTPADIPCPGQDEILIMEMKPFKSRPGLSGDRNFFMNYTTDLQGHGRNFDGHFGFNVAGFNYYIASLQQYPSGITNIEADALYQKHFDLIHSFSIMGVINSEQFASGGASYQASSNTHGLSSNKNQKTINVVHQGGVLIKNLFGSLRAGDQIYFIWKKVPSPSFYVLDDKKKQVSVKADAGYNLSSRPFQLVPYVHPEHHIPPMSELEFESDHHLWSAQQQQQKIVSGIIIAPRAPLKRTGISILFGQVNKPSESTSTNLNVQIQNVRASCARAMYDANVGNTNFYSVFVTPSVKFPFVEIESKIMDLYDKDGRRVISTMSEKYDNNRKLMKQ